MLFVSWLSWWYTRGWSSVATGIRARLVRLSQNFSVGLLLQTLFAPWRRIVTSSSGSMSQRLRASVDNTVSRFVGLAVRLLALLAAFVAMLGIGLGGGILILAWPFVPVAGVILIFVGISK
ncbi:hypothetical protein HJC99_05070 [Candidatus Saccharibacteria bacterium]|nr:hypothetical protein [Candidatus Saccharibacteria bacterium]